MLLSNGMHSIEIEDGPGIPTQNNSIAIVQANVSLKKEKERTKPLISLLHTSQC